MQPYPRFIGPSDVAQSSIADNARTVNFYVEITPTGPAMYPTPGVSTFATSTGSPGRGGIFVHKDKAYAVIGSSFGEITQVSTTTGLFTVLGTVAVDANPATICTNGDGGGQIFVTSGNNGYLWDLSALTWTQVRTGATTMGAHLDGYFIALDAATSTIFLSDLLDGTTWDPTQFAQRSIRPDPWVAMAVLDRYLWLFGSQTSEVWYNAGTFPFPFAPHPSGLVQYGCAAAFSPKVVNGALMWVSATADGAGQVLQSSGFSPEVVSSFAVDVSIAAMSAIDDAIGDTYTDLGHTFYLLTFPTGAKTWCYDATAALQLPTAQRWHERVTWVAERSAEDAWRPLFHGYAFGTHLMLDRANGTIYRMAADLGFDADSRPLRRLRRPPALWKANARLTVPEFELYLEPGLGLASGQGSDPTVSLRISRDGGKTWGSERFRSAGARGEYDTRVTFKKNGAGRRWQPEVVVSDPVPWRLTGAGVRVEEER